MLRVNHYILPVGYFCFQMEANLFLTLQVDYHLWQDYKDQCFQKLAYAACLTFFQD